MTGQPINQSECFASIGFAFMPGGTEAMAEAKALGRAGEAAVGIWGSKVGIKVGGKTRFPDRITKSTLEEVKNVKHLSFTSQLRDYSTFAKQNSLDFILYTRPNTIISRPLQNAIDGGLIIRKFIPH